MSYQLYDAKGYVADFATGSGLYGFIKYLRAQDDKDLHVLAENMALDLTDEIRAKLKGLPLPGDPSTRSILAALKSHIDDLDDVLIIGDGLEVGEEKADADAEVKARRAQGAQLRDRTAQSYRRVFRESASSVVEREKDEVLKAARKYLGAGHSAEFLKWIEEYYRDFPAFVAKRTRAAATALAEVIETLSKSEIGSEADTSGKVKSFVEQYLPALGKRYADSSRGQLKEVSAQPEPLAAVERRLDEWEETRADKVALNETVQLANAVARTVFAASGITRLRWRAQGSESCEFCQEMDGKVVGIEQNFSYRGEEVDADGRRLKVNRDTAHPPIHAGCSCAIVPD